jgi:hypothetical protein
MARDAQTIRSSVLTGSRAKAVLVVAGEHQDPERVSSSLPQKQGLCQVVNGPCFWNVIRLLTGIREGYAETSMILKPSN